MDPCIEALAATQGGVVSRAQLLELGHRDHDIARWVRRRELGRAQLGVYAVHTGPLDWPGRAWAATLLHRPAALGGPSALRAHGLRSGASSDGDPIDLCIDAARRVDDPAGVCTRRIAGFDAVALLHLGPPRVRVEHSALTVASAAGNDDAAVAVLSDAVGSRRTTPARLRTGLAALPRLPRRGFLGEVLADVDAGAISALERRYLRDVERRHGLPRGVRQRRRRSEDGVVFEDVVYRQHGVVVELDGRLGHDLADDRWDDLQRDLLAAAAGDLTLRLGWRQAVAACRTAALVAGVLAARGWRDALTACHVCPPVDHGGSRSPRG